MSTSTGIREIRPEDQKAVLGICAATGLFEPEELEFLEGMRGWYKDGDDKVIFRKSLTATA